MAFCNDHFRQLEQNYLFSEVGDRADAFTAAHPEKTVIRLGIGDVTQPLPKACVDAMVKATQEMGRADTFRGYKSDNGYEWLREAILKRDYAERGVTLSLDEIFINDGAKSDTGNIGDIFAENNVVAITDPVYPVYMDTSVMAGREIRWLPCREETGFAPAIPSFHTDMIYLCSPNNPTGAALNREQLTAWVRYARENDAVILFDAAYERFITEPGVPHSIFEIDGARECAVEFRSFSKTAGFTGVRCGYTVIPKELTAKGADGTPVSLHALWTRRQGTKFNGTAYMVQRGAEAVYTPEGEAQAMANIRYYAENARIIREGLTQAGFTCFGGVNAPYIWLKCPGGMKSWAFFDALMERTAVVGTPGAGFGSCGEGYFRLTAFGSRESAKEAVSRIQASGLGDRA